MDLGCHAGQGFWLMPPLAADALRDLPRKGQMWSDQSRRAA
jgi:hypothetical protein